MRDLIYYGNPVRASYPLIGGLVAVWMPLPWWAGGNRLYNINKARFPYGAGILSGTTGMPSWVGSADGELNWPALHFTNANLQYVSLDVADYVVGKSSPSTFTISIRFRTTSTTSSIYLYSEGDSNGLSPSFRIYLNRSTSGDIGVQLRDSNSLDIVNFDPATNYGCNDGKWHTIMVIIPVNNSTWYVYLDGVQKGSGTRNNSGVDPTTLNQAAIGALRRNAIAGGTGFEGDIRCVKTWNRDLPLWAPYFDFLDDSTDHSLLIDRIFPYKFDSGGATAYDETGRILSSGLVSVSENDLFAALEQNRANTILAQVSANSVFAALETSKVLALVLSSNAETDLAAFSETNKQVTVLTSVSENDLEAVLEAGRVLSAVLVGTNETDVEAAKELNRGLSTIIAQINETDKLDGFELGRQLSLILAQISEIDSLNGGNFSELDRNLGNVLSQVVTSDRLGASEGNRSSTILVQLSETDATGLLEVLSLGGRCVTVISDNSTMNESTGFAVLAVVRETDTQGGSAANFVLLKGTRLKDLLSGRRLEN